MLPFSYHNPTRVHFGVGLIQTLGKEMQDAGVKHCLLVAGGGSIKENGVLSQVQSTLEQHGIKYTEAWGVQANPVLDKVREMVKLAQEKGVDAILAVGGGSVIDSAKSVAAGVFLRDPWHAFTKEEPVLKALPLYTVLTISATGSEMNGNAVLTNTATQQKWDFYSAKVYPQVTIIDPAVQCSLPYKLTVSGALDAISHILEYYFADPDALTTLAIDDALLKTIVEMADRLKNNPADLVARGNLAWCATLALNGISGIGLKGGDWACHQIEHALSALHPQIAHGEGLGVIFPAWIEYLSEKEPARFIRWTKNMWGEDNVSRGVQRFRDKLESWGMATRLRDLGIKESELPIILKLIMTSPQVGAISKLNAANIESLLMLAY
jgi:alcohol dehydrogenase YqhD (iron-dependent ADH family)